MPKILPDFLLVFGNVECFNFLVNNLFRSFFDVFLIEQTKS